MKRISRLAASVAVAACAVTVVPGAAHAAPPPGGVCIEPDGPHGTVHAEPWAQQMLDPKSVWPYTTGAGVTVAVIDSGVDSDHPQLRGKVLPGRDFYYGNRTFNGDFDCVSHGTEVGSIIAARPVGGVGFAGLAPGARILPVRVVERETADDGTQEQINTVVLSEGIRYAVDSGARILNLSLAGPGDHADVRAAIAYAVRRNVLVVAAAGNGQQPGIGIRKTYPAAYPGVLGVAAIDNSGQRLSSSQIGPQVDISAPGGGVVGATRVAGHAYIQGTSFAAPFVSATAALIWSRYPQLTAKQVADRLRATATAAPGGKDSLEYGAGLVNPYRAVTEQLAAGAPAPLPVVNKQYVDPEKVRAEAWWSSAGNGARIGALLAGAVALLGGTLALVLTFGRRGRWQAKRAAPLPTDRHLDEPPDQVFLLPPPDSER